MQSYFLDKKISKAIWHNGISEKIVLVLIGFGFRGFMSLKGDNYHCLISLYC